MIKYILLLACATAISGEEKWAWSSSNRNGNGNEAQQNENNRNDRFDRRQQRLEDLQDRYEVVEPTTKRPVNQKPQQDDEYFGGSEIGPNSQRFNFNGLNGGGGIYPQGGFPQGIPQGIGGYPTAFNGPHGPIRGQYQPNGFGPTGGYYPGVGGIGGQYPGIGQYPGVTGIGQYPGGVGGIGHYPGSAGGIGQYPGSAGGIGHYPGNIGGPNHGIHSGKLPVLVGPGGPTGHIGRPGYGPNRAHPNNGILVGPGGPTGIIGRPNGYGSGNGYGAGYGPLGGHVGNVPGAFNGIGTGFAGGPYRPSGPAIGIPYAAEFDDYDNDVDKKKRVEKKSIDDTN